MSDPQDYELVRTPNGPAHYEIIRKPANWSDWLPSHPDLPVYEATRLGVRPGGTRLNLPPEAPVAPEPRTASTADELDALPVGSVLALDCHTPWTRIGPRWSRSGVHATSDVLATLAAQDDTGGYRLLRRGWGNGPPIYGTSPYRHLHYEWLGIDHADQ